TCTPGAAEHDDAARTRQRQPGPVAVQRLRIPLARPMAPGPHLDLASPAHLVATARAAERPLDGWQRPFPLGAKDPGRDRWLRPGSLGRGYLGLGYLGLGGGGLRGGLGGGL